MDEPGGSAGTIPPAQETPEQTSGAQRAPLFVALTLILLCLAIIGGSVWLSSWSFGPQPQIVPLGAITPLSTQIRTGWEQTGPTFAQGIVFAPSAPETAYTCGVSTSTSPGPISLGVSTDGGENWRTLQTPAAGALCQLIVNPRNARDLVLAEIPANFGTANNFYRSTDGGATWRNFPLPKLDTEPEGVRSFQWAWAGDTLYVLPGYNGGGALRRLAASRDGAAFRWLDTTALFAGFASTQGVTSLIPSATALYVRIDPAVDCLAAASSPACYPFRRTLDSGATWQDYAGTLPDGQPVYPTASQPLGKALFAYYDFVKTDDGGQMPTRYAVSQDNGATWTALPLLELDLNTAHIAQAPNGTIYLAAVALDPTTTASGIYALPDGTTWELVTLQPSEALGYAGSVAFAWNAQGQPTALWAYANSYGASVATTGLLRYTL